MPNITDGALLQVEYDTSADEVYLWPHNSEGKAALDAIFADMGALTTVAITQADAVRSGFGDTTQPYKGLKLALS